jgi:hypothetical protein
MGCNELFFCSQSYGLYLIERLLGPEAEPEPRYAAGQDHGGQET